MPIAPERLRTALDAVRLLSAESEIDSLAGQADFARMNSRIPNTTSVQIVTPGLMSNGVPRPSPASAAARRKLTGGIRGS